MKIGERGQITIPKKLRIRYGLDKHTDVEFVDQGDGIKIIKSGSVADRIAQVRGIKKLKHAESVDKYIEDIRGR